MKALALSSSPRKDGNSRLLAEAVLNGAASRGHDVDLVDLAGEVTEPLRDCRTCRLSDGRCSIDDGYEEVLRRVLAADALVLATPLYWYGISGQLKIFIDRLFCHAGSGHPNPGEVKRRLMHKRMAVAVSSEETYPGSMLGVTAQLSELARYLRHDLVGVVRGVANTRGEVVRDPSESMRQAYNLGTRLLDGTVTDYRMDSVRSGVIWKTPPSGSSMTAGHGRSAE